jgi:PKD repeat protein
MSFTIAIKTDYSGDDITAYQFTLSYDPSILNGVSVTNGDLIVDGSAMFLPGTFDNTAGKLSLTGAFFFFTIPPPEVASGPGTLANVTFTVVGYGCSDIILGPETNLYGWNFTEGDEYKIIEGDTMPNHLGHGYFSNSPSTTFDLTIAVFGSGSTVPAVGNHTYAEGTLVSVTATADPGWTFNNWLLDGVPAGSVNPIEVTMDDDHALTAYFVGMPDYPSVYVDPPSTIDPSLTPGSTYIVSIKTDYTGLDITAYQFTLSFNPTVLNGVSVANGDVITYSEGYHVFVPGTFDNVAGELSLTGAFFFEAGVTAPGPGTLAYVTFTVVGVGCSDIILGPETQLVGWDPILIQEYHIVNGVTMPFHLGHGYFCNVGENLPPMANFTYSPTFPYVGQAVTFDASGSSDIDGTIVSYEWDFGDGSTGTDVLTPYTYESAGTFTVTLTVTDDLGATDTLQQEITVDPLPTLTITINNIKKGTTETILLELVDDDYDGFITQDINNRILSIIKRTHKTTTFNFPGTYTATKGALEVTLQSRNNFTITLS